MIEKLNPNNLLETPFKKPLGVLSMKINELIEVVNEMQISLIAYENRYHPVLSETIPSIQEPKEEYIGRLHVERITNEARKRAEAREEREKEHKYICDNPVCSGIHSHSDCPYTKSVEKAITAEKERIIGELEKQNFSKKVVGFNKHARGYVAGIQIAIKIVRGEDGE